MFPVSGPTLFQMTFTAALWVTVFEEVFNIVEKRLEGKCGPPPDLPYALPVSDTNQTDFESHTSLKYNCRPGYTRATSSQTIYCSSSGEWRISISCVKKSCRNPGDLQNGQVEVKTDFSFGSQIEFSCSEGYILIVAKCGPPPDISNGKHNGRDEDFFTYRSSVTYRCDPNFSLFGNASITCTVMNKTVGVWSPNPPTCERIICSRPNISRGIIVSGFKPTYKYKDSVRLDCLKGSVLRGNSVSHCKADGSWSPLPICERNSCTNIPDIPNAYWINNPKPRKEDVYAVGTVFHYRCRPGYEPATKELMAVICQKDFSWSPFKGCKEICCPAPDPKSVRVIRHTKVHPVNGCTYSYDDTVSYVCNDGSKIFSATCKSNGKWTPQAPSCYPNQLVAIFRPPLLTDVIQNLHSTPSQLSLRTNVMKDTDWLERRPSPAAIQNGPQQLHSVKSLCRKPVIGNGMLSVDKDQYVESENVTIQCYFGFAMLGSQSITCSENGTWYPEVPRCEQEIPTDCKHVFAGKKTMQCLPSSNDVKMALEVYKLTLEIKLLELQIDKAKHTDREL
ncbi:Zona pellucida sperm-binding protein 3 receptor [Apodemus speciosus]|uniref:Zona pellucida sperm-binding protein 3 receptor n=1 Tax=Apodemus speciosus TaxID=105296 RepID=A0ABQ0EEL8_APOSI